MIDSDGLETRLSSVKTTLTLIRLDTGGLKGSRLEIFEGFPFHSGHALLSGIIKMASTSGALMSTSTSIRNAGKLLRGSTSWVFSAKRLKLQRFYFHLKSSSAFFELKSFRPFPFTAHPRGLSSTSTRLLHRSEVVHVGKVT